MLFGIDSWNVTDRAPGVELADLPPSPEKAWVLIARNKNACRLQYGFIHVSGAIEMMRGMEYHHKAFGVLCRRFARGRGGEEDYTALRHEAVAYLNRVGQFYAFAKSEFVEIAGIDAATALPTATRFMVFRNKHVAHRSIDAPRPDDTDALKLSHAWCLASSGPLLFAPKPGTPLHSAANVRTFADFARVMRSGFRRGYVGFQIQDKTDHINFHLEAEHPKIVLEAYELIERLVLSP